MPNQFNGYCYPTIDDAAKADLTAPLLSVSSGVVSPSGYVVLTPETVEMTVTHRSFETGDITSYTVTRTYTACTSVGQLNNNSGISVEDALWTSWAVVACWAAVYFFVLARSASRGY